jgi:uncharacterized damage-inducible protein DinB
MAMKDALLPEFDHEMGTTRRLIERVPDDKLGWRPHEKSMSLGRLATHVVELPQWAQTIMRDGVFDMKPGEYQPKTLGSRAELLAFFDEKVAAMRGVIAAATDAELMSTWTFKSGGHEVFSMPKAAVFRGFVMNHLIHHRGQLSVYLRLNDVPLPPIYGPSADERK